MTQGRFDASRKDLKPEIYFFFFSILSAGEPKSYNAPPKPKNQSSTVFYHNTGAWGFSGFSKMQGNQNEKSFYKCLETFIQSINPNLAGFRAGAALRAVQIQTMSAQQWA